MAWAVAGAKEAAEQLSFVVVLAVAGAKQAAEKRILGRDFSLVFEVGNKWTCVETTRSRVVYTAM
jgi:hypothetical protein